MNRKHKPVPREHLAPPRPGRRPFLVQAPPVGDPVGQRFFRGVIIALVIEAVAALFVWAGISIWSAYSTLFL